MAGLCNRCGKTPFQSRGEAAHGATEMNKRRQLRFFVYFDELCKAWHISSQKDPSTKAIRRHRGRAS